MTVTTIIVIAIVLALVAALSLTVAAIVRTVANSNNITGTSQENDSDVMMATYIKRFIDLCRDNWNVIYYKRGIEFFHFFSDAKVYIDERNYRVKFDGTIDDQVVHLDFYALDYIPRDKVHHFTYCMLPKYVKYCVLADRHYGFIDVYDNSLDYDWHTLTCSHTQYGEFYTSDYIEKTSFITGDTKYLNKYDQWADDYLTTYRITFIIENPKERRDAIYNFSF